MEVYKDDIGYFIIQNNIKKYISAQEARAIINGMYQRSNNMQYNQPTHMGYNPNMSHGYTPTIMQTPTYNHPQNMMYDNPMGKRSANSYGVIGTSIPDESTFTNNDIAQSTNSIDEHIRKMMMERQKQQKQQRGFEARPINEEPKKPKRKEKKVKSIDIYNFTHSGVADEVKRVEVECLEPGLIIRDDVEFGKSVAEIFYLKTKKKNGKFNKYLKAIEEAIAFRKMPDTDFPDEDPILKEYLEKFNATRQHYIHSPQYIPKALDWAINAEDDNGFLDTMMDILKEFEEYLKEPKDEVVTVEDTAVYHTFSYPNLTKMMDSMEPGITYTFNGDFDLVVPDFETEANTIVYIDYHKLTRYLVRENGRLVLREV